ADAGHQFAEPERLDHVVVGAPLQADDPRDLPRAGGDGGCPHPRHGPPPPGPRPCPPDLEAGAGGAGGQWLGDRVVVFNQQHAHAHRMTPGFVARRGFAGSWAPPNRALASAFPAIPYREPIPAVFDTRRSSMKRRTALVTAGVVTVVLLAAAAAVAVNLGLLGVATAAGPVGELT